MDVAIPVFEGFDELDAVAPYEAFQLAGARGCEIEARLVTLEPTPAVEARSGLTIVPDGTLDEQTPDLVVVPGGGWNDGGGVRREYERGALSGAVADCHASGARVASVCTGAFILERAGLLEGRPATTHHTAVDDLSATGAEVRETRFVDDGDVATAGGITAGIDLALHVVATEFDADTADAVARDLAYERADERAI
jgi:transcriptional regulator GlxA family with amidase domain